MPISDETINASAVQAEQDATESEEPGFDELSATRQRTVMQSFMIYNIGAFAGLSEQLTTNRFKYGNYEKLIKIKGPPAGIINKLTMVSGSTEFIEMKPHEISNFVPKIRLFKVLYNEDGSLDKEIELQFPTRIDKAPGDENYQPGQYKTYGGGNKAIPPPGNILDQTTNSGVGIKSFDYEFIGSNPATVRSDVKAKMVLFFQNFSELLRVRYAPDGTPYAFMDLFDRSRGLKNGTDKKKSSGYTPPDTNTFDPSKFGIEIPAGCDPGDLPETRNSYDPTAFEIRAVVGWADMSAGGSSITDNRLKEVGKNANYSFALTLIDHDFAFEDDGTFTLTLDYRARLAGILADSKADVLNLTNFTESDIGVAYGASAQWLPEGLANYAGASLGGLNPFFKGQVNGSPQEIIQAFEYFINYAKACCDDEGEKRAKEALSAYKDILRTYQYRLATQWLMTQGKLFSLEVDASILRAFAQKKEDIGYAITPQMLGTGVASQATVEQLTSEITSAVLTEGIRGKPVDDWKTVMDKELDLENAETVKINYFYLGDLVEWGAKNAMASIKSGENETLWDPSITDRIKVLLGSINIENPIPNQQDINMSLADVPISFETFKNFWFQKVIKPRRDNYPLIHFVRDVVKMAAQDALNSPWLNKDEDKRQRVILRTATISLPTTDDEDPLVLWMKNHSPSGNEKTDPYIRYSTVDFEAITELDPLTFRKSDVDVNNLYNYFVVYLENGSLSYLSKSAVDASSYPTRRDYDKHIGIHHFGFGESKGILKTAKFSKTNAPYLREARYQSHRGYSPFDQLSAVYEVEITTFGAPFYYPGQYVWIEPRGLNYNTDPDYRLGSPDAGYNEDGSGGSFSFLMGLGGYHIITKVGGYLEDGKYETKIHCRYDNSGADRGGGRGRGTQDEEGNKCETPEPKGYFSMFSS